MKYWQMIADNLSKSGWNCDCISSTDHEGRQFWVAAAEHEDAGRFIVRADQDLPPLSNSNRQFAKALAYQIQADQPRVRQGITRKSGARAKSRLEWNVDPRYP